MVPAKCNGAWACYAWDMKDHIANIIDPSAGQIDEDFIVMMHSSTIRLLGLCLSYCVANLFTGWDLDLGDFKKVIRLSDRPCHRSDSGIYTLYCMKNFEGTSKIHTSEVSYTH